jgi:hypothetical protein
MLHFHVNQKDSILGLYAHHCTPIQRAHLNWLVYVASHDLSELNFLYHPYLTLSRLHIHEAFFILQYEDQNFPGALYTAKRAHLY